MTVSTMNKHFGDDPAASCLGDCVYKYAVVRFLRGHRELTVGEFNNLVHALCCQDFQLLLAPLYGFNLLGNTYLRDASQEFELLMGIDSEKSLSDTVDRIERCLSEMLRRIPLAQLGQDIHLVSNEGVWQYRWEGTEGLWYADYTIFHGSGKSRGKARFSAVLQGYFGCSGIW